MKLKSISYLGLATLCACTSPDMTNRVKQMTEANSGPTALMNASLINEKNKTAIRGTAASTDALALEQSKMPVLRFSKSTYIGSQMVPVTNDDKLPSIFRQQFSVYTDDRESGRTVTLGAIANRIFNSTGILVRIQPDVTSLVVNGDGAEQKNNTNGGTIKAGANSFVPPRLPPLSVDMADLKHSGTLVGFLNNLTDRLGLAWEYRDNTVVIMRFVTESHEISALIGSTTFEMTGGQTSAGTTDQKQTSETKLFVKEAGTTNPLATLVSTIEKMVKDVEGSTVTLADGSRKLIVKTSREMQAQVRDLIAAENATMQKQALVQFDIYSIKESDADERGVDWNVAFKALSNVYGINIGSPQTLTGTTAGTWGTSILEGNSDASSRLANTRVLFNMLKESGTTVQHRTVPMIAMNGQWARKSQLNTESYIAETTPGASSAVGAGAPGIKTEKVSTGDTYQVMVQIQNNNSIFLKMGVTLSDLLGLTDITSGVGVNQQKVQTPKVSAISDQSVVLMRPGQVMAISGLSRDISIADKRTLSEDSPMFFGGSRKLGTTREHFIIFVRPVVL